jgi:FkbM family methyltransferase
MQPFIIDYLRILRRHQHPARFVAGRALVKSGLCKFLTIQQKDYKLHFFPSNLSESLWVDPMWREPELAFFRAYLKPGNRVIDVGANIGDTALAASSQVGVAGRVWAVEPHPNTFAYLKKNVELNRRGNIELIHAAASSQRGSLSLSNDRRDDMNRVVTNGVPVRAERLDDLVEQTDDINLLKIDVEGYELSVLRGAGRILKFTQVVYFEVSEMMFRSFGYTVTDVFDCLHSVGFQLLKISGPCTLANIDVTYVPSEVENLLAVRNVDEVVRKTGWVLL